VDKVKYSDCRIRPAIPELDSWRLYEDLRVEDMLEVIGLGHHPRLAIEASFECSQKAYTIMSATDNNIVASFGVCPTHLERVGCVWLLGTYRMLDIQRTFIRHSRAWLNEVMGDYSYVTNIVSMSNHLSMRWLKWLGADFLREEPEGYQEFVIFNNNNSTEE
jgi:hypothetical protein